MFIILIALLTTILSIPILLLLHYLINGYGSNWPGGRVFRDIQDEDRELPGRKSVDRSISPSVSSSTLSRGSFSSATFANELKKGLSEYDTVDSRQINIMSQIAYAGTYVQLH